MSECNKRNEWIDKYCAGELRGEELDRFERILRKDKKLQEEVIIERHLISAFSNPDLFAFRNLVLKAQARQAPALWKRRFLIAAIIIILISSGSVTWFLASYRRVSSDMALSPGKTTDHLHISPGKTDEKDPEPLPLPQKPERNRKVSDTNEVLADCMRPYPYLEGLIGEETRSPGFTLIEPGCRAEMKTGDSLCFRWIITSSATIKLEIFDNNGDHVRSMVTDNSTFLCYATSGHHQGLYYWKLIRSNELLCVGRFVLR